MEEQKKYFGWPGIPPTLYSDLLPAKVPKSKLKTRKTCLTGKSACKPSCNDIVNNDLKMNMERNQSGNGNGSGGGSGCLLNTSPSPRDS